MREKFDALGEKIRDNPAVAAVSAWPIWKQIARRFNPVARQFDGPRFMRFEVVFMRILFAYIVFQSMPLGEPFSNATQRLIPSLEPVMADPEMNNALRPPPPRFEFGPEESNLRIGVLPPLLPVSEMAPNSQGTIKYREQRKPNGFAYLFNLTFFSDERFIAALPWIVIPCLIAYAAGIGLPVALPILAFVSIGSRTLYNSQGYIHHGYQMLSLVLVAQTVVVLWHCFRHDWREAFGLRRAEPIRGRVFWDWLVRYSQWMIVICYVVAGVIKPIRSDGEWFQNSHFIGIQVVKTHRQNFYSELDEEWNIPNPPVANLMLKEHPNLIRIFLTMGVLLEIFAFLALYNRLLSLLFGFALVMFHYFNDLLMGLYFYGNEKLVWVFLINLPYWIWWLFLRRRVRQEQEIGEVEVEPAAA